MNRVICVKGHFYDGDKYDACPHCAAGVAAVAQSAFAVKYGEGTGERKSEKVSEKRNEGKPKKEKKGLFGRKNTHEGKQEAVKAESDETLLLHDAVTGPIDSQSVASQPLTGWPPAVNSSGMNQPVVSQPVNSKSTVGQSVVSQPVNSQSVAAGQQAAFATASQPVINQPISMPPVTAPSEENQSLSAAFAAAAQKSEEKDEGRTVGYFSTSANPEPPVGYLICIAGEDFGIGFPLKSGSNSMGRSASMDVVVMDAKVSREKQAFVIYEPLKREFYLKPGEGSSLCYLNGNVVLEIMKLTQHDIIMLGNTKLMLVPVCGENFSWDDIVD